MQCSLYARNPHLRQHRVTKKLCHLRCQQPFPQHVYKVYTYLAINIIKNHFSVDYGAQLSIIVNLKF